MPLHGRFSGVVIALLLASSALAACTGAVAPATGSSGAQSQESGNSGGQDNGAVTLPDPCSLLTPDEIKAQFTFDVNPGIGSSAPDSGATAPNCNWSTVDFHPEFSGVQLTVQKFDQGFFDFIKGTNSKDVTGLGDAAYFQQPTNPFTLEMKKGDLHFTLYVVAGGTAESPETLQQRVIALANNVLAHL